MGSGLENGKDRKLLTAPVEAVAGENEFGKTERPQRGRILYSPLCFKPAGTAFALRRSWEKPLARRTTRAASALSARTGAETTCQDPYPQAPGEILTRVDSTVAHTPKF